MLCRGSLRYRIMTYTKPVGISITITKQNDKTRWISHNISFFYETKAGNGMIQSKAKQIMAKDPTMGFPENDTWTMTSPFLHLLNSFHFPQSSRPAPNSQPISVTKFFYSHHNNPHDIKKKNIFRWSNHNLWVQFQTQTPSTRIQFFVVC